MCGDPRGKPYRLNARVPRAHPSLRLVGLPVGGAFSSLDPWARVIEASAVRVRPQLGSLAAGDDPIDPALQFSEGPEMAVHVPDLDRLTEGFDPAPERSHSLSADCYTKAEFMEIERQAIFFRSWQYVCHAEVLRRPGDYIAFDVQGQSLFAIRDQAGALRAFYNVCQHRAHELLSGQGNTKHIVCPYHAWSYGLDGRLRTARRTEHIADFEASSVCLKPVRIEEFCTLVFVNLDPNAPALSDQSGGLGDEIRSYAPDLDRLTRARRLTYTFKSNWKNVIDNFLECYHCPIAHKDFVSLVDMDSYRVTTHGIYSSHMSRAGTKANTAYDVAGADVQDHAVWWLWPNICLLRFPGSGNLMVLNVVPLGIDTTFESYDFYFLQEQPTEQQEKALEYVDKVLQAEDIAIVESVQRGMSTPAFDRGRFIVDPERSGLSEHGVHHFHGLVLEAYRQIAGAQER